MSTTDIDDGDRADEPAYEWYDADWPTPVTPKWLVEWEAAVAAFMDVDPDDKPVPPPEPKSLPANALRHRPGWEQA